MKKRIHEHLKLFSIMIMQLERDANEGKIDRDTAVKGFADNADDFTDRIYEEFTDIKKVIDSIFALEEDL